MRLVGVAAGLCVWALAARPAGAGGNDLALSQLCTPEPVGRIGGGRALECGWVRRDAATGLIDTVAPDMDAGSRFRSLMSELGVVMAPRLMVPAQTLGIAGFQLSAEVGSTGISAGESFWNAARTVSPQAPTMRRPPDALTTVGAYLRKGLWLPLPGFEVGGGVMHLTDSRLLSWQGYAKVALHEGFHDWPLPSVAVRGSAAAVTGSDEVGLSILGLDLVASKGWALLKTARLEPFAGVSFLWITARASPIDVTPECDAFAARVAWPDQPLGEGCAPAQRGTDNDARADFTFEDQDAIRRHRFFGGAKLRFASVFVAVQYELTPGGASRDGRPNGARDRSGDQTALALSAGFDY